MLSINFLSSPVCLDSFFKFPLEMDKATFRDGKKARVIGLLISEDVHNEILWHQP